MFRPKNNYNDPYLFLDERETIGTTMWWKRKFGEKFDDNTYYLLEVMSRKEYDKVDLQEALDEYENHLRLQQKTIEKELTEQGYYSTFENQPLEKVERNCLTGAEPRVEPNQSFQKVEPNCSAEAEPPVEEKTE